MTQEPAAALPDTLALAWKDTETLADAEAAAVTWDAKLEAKLAHVVMLAVRSSPNVAA